MERLAQPPAEEDFAEWQDAPLLLRAAPLPYQRLPAGADPCAIRINDGRRIEFETDLFRGCAVIWVDGVASTPAGLFSGQRRKTSITIQVQQCVSICSNHNSCSKCIILVRGPLV